MEISWIVDQLWIYPTS